MTNERAIPPACDSEYHWRDSEHFLSWVFCEKVRGKKRQCGEREELVRAFEAGRKQIPPPAWAKSKIYEWHDAYTYLAGNFANRPLAGEVAIRGAFHAGRALKANRGFFISPLPTEPATPRFPVHTGIDRARGVKGGYV